MNKIQKTVKQLYQDDAGEPITLTEGQSELFDMVFKKKYPRIHVSTYTRYGKSLTVALGVLTRVTTFPEKWAIIAPKKDQAKIIMGYIIQHIFDNPYCVERLKIGEHESLERLRRERSKKRLTFKLGDGKFGEVFILSAQARRQTKVENALMGFGAPNIVEDESALIPDNLHSTVLRMLGERKDTFLFKVGNPWHRNHFLRSYRSDRYHNFIVDWRQGVKEGRLTQEQVEELREELNEQYFDVLYECQFPSEAMIDEKGYSLLLLEKDLDKAYIKSDIEPIGERRLGIDVAGGGRNESVVVFRTDNFAKVVWRGQQPDTMAFAGKVREIKNQLGVDNGNIFIDNIGVGKGFYDRLLEQNPGVVGVNFGEKPEEKEDFLNKRAQSYWRLAQWIKNGGKLVENSGFEDLMDIKYKTQSDKKVKIKSKDEMLREGIQSPDVPDALALTFARRRKASEKVSTYKPQWKGYGKKV